MNGYTKLTHGANEQDFDFRTTAVLLGEFWPTKSTIEKPMRLVGDKLAPAMLEKSWNRFAVPARLKMPYPKVANGFELIDRPAVFTDTHNRIQPLTQLRDSLAVCGDDVVQGLGELGTWVKKNQTKLDDPGVAEDFQARGPRFDLAFEIQSPDPIEEIVVTRCRVSTKKA